MIGEQFNTSGDMDNVYDQLKDGRKLCKYEFILYFFFHLLNSSFRLMNSIVPNSVPKINAGK